eukprot:GGOE01062165.1.p1 GENE.GGOE01062165.1~~GGOE01062165.1.p1  ORF type:complete len:712 (-),score=170.65 GGOE01062165.1:138-2204(-)
MAAPKGLANALGRNNCFLNVVIQSLWHTRPFRVAFQQHCTRHPPCPLATPCLACALRDVFSGLEESGTQAVSPDALRRVLATVHEQFDKGRMNDAAETFDILLDTLHATTMTFPGDSTAKPNSNSFVRRVFCLEFTQTVQCPHCKRGPEALLFATNLYYIPASAVAENRADLPFGSLLRQLCQTEHKSCDAPGCSATPLPVVTTSTALPEVLVVGVVWSGTYVPRDELLGFLANLRCGMRIADLFEGAPEGMTAALTGLVLFHASHYIALLWCDTSRQWLLFDDRHVRPLSAEWGAVRRHLLQGRLQPLLLFYTVQESLQDVVTAPDQEDTVRSICKELEEKPEVPDRKRARGEFETEESDAFTRLEEIFGEQYTPHQLNVLLALHDGDVQRVIEALTEGGDVFIPDSLADDGWLDFPLDKSLEAERSSASCLSPFTVPSSRAHVPPSPVFQDATRRYKCHAVPTSPQPLRLSEGGRAPAIFKDCTFLLLGQNKACGAKVTLQQRIQDAGGKVAIRPLREVTHIIVMDSSLDPTAVAKSAHCKHVLSHTFLTKSLQQRRRDPEEDHLWRPVQHKLLLRDQPSPMLKRPPPPPPPPSLPRGAVVHIDSDPEEAGRPKSHDGGVAEEPPDKADGTLFADHSGSPSQFPPIAWVASPEGRSPGTGSSAHSLGRERMRQFSRRSRLQKPLFS